MKRSGMFILLVLFCCVGRLAAQQARITGRVLESERGTPLANANVFLANTPFGTGTGTDGSFRVTGVPPGVYTLVVSLVGYQVRTRQVHVAGADSLQLTFYLQPRSLETEEIQTVAVAPVEWRSLLKVFVREFIGQTPNAEKTRLLNPEVLNLCRDSISHLLIASSDSIIRVENNALGYRLSIVLATFKWNTEGETSFIASFVYGGEQIVLTRSDEEELVSCYKMLFRHLDEKLGPGQVTGPQ